GGGRGPPLNNGNGNNSQDSGQVRVYDWDGSVWVQRGLDIDGEAADDNSGESVAASDDGNTVVVGARFNDGSGNNSQDSGQVRVYDWDGSLWVQRGQDIDGEAAGDNSGYSVAASGAGNTVVIGARLNDGNGNNSGQVRIYDWDGSLWVQRAQDTDGEAADDWSGTSVAASGDGNTVVVGARLNDGNGSRSGQVRVYEVYGGTVTGTIQNDDFPNYDFTAATFNLSEGAASNTTSLVMLTRDDSSAAESVDVVLAPGAANPATVGDDFTAGPININFAIGETTRPVPIELLGDTTLEPNESIALSLANFSGSGQVGSSHPISTLTITNDDIDVSVIVAPATVTEDGVANLVYTFARAGDTSGELTVNFNVAGSANLSDDYSSSGDDSFTVTSGTVTFAAGNDTAVVTLDPLTDAVVELNETVVLTVAAGTGYNIGSPVNATGTITNDDAISVVAFEINADQIDPPDLGKGEQPVSWMLQRSELATLRLVLSGVAATVTPDDLRLTNLGQDADNDSDVEFTLNSDHVAHTENVIKLSFSPEELDEGVYRLELLDSVTDPQGQRLDGDGDGQPGGDYVVEGDSTNRLYRMISDFNGDFGVSVFDFSTFSYWFGTDTDVAPRYADMNLDGGVSVFDFTLFSSNFGESVSFPNALIARVTPQTRIALTETPLTQQPTIRQDAPDWTINPSKRSQPLEFHAGELDAKAADLAIIDWLDDRHL
ncbi:MAG: hypothetical protein ACI9HK_003215, partial [Pirellulaceae bacterium]